MLLIMIITVAIILGIVLIFGGIKAKQYDDYKEELETSACKMAEEENYTEAICKGFENLCKVKFEKLVNNNYIKESLKNPLTNELAGNDSKSYIEITFNNNKMICDYKEG